MTSLRTRQDIENFTFEEAFELFFEPPSVDRGDGWVSPLCLCRQELQDCFVGEIVGEDRILDYPKHRLFASAMVALSGIELMARMIPPPQGSGGSGKLFLAFLASYSRLAGMALSEQQARLLLDLRNSLSHTFGLYSVDDKGAHQQLFVFSTDNPQEFVRQREEGGYEICVELLVRLLVRTVDAFQRHLLQTPHLHPHFMMGFHKYGRLFQRGPHVA
jgi:hypothetical protein